MPIGDGLTYAVDGQMLGDVGAQGRGVEQRVYGATTDQSAEREIAQPAQAAAPQGDRIGAKDVLDRQVGPEMRQLLRGGGEVAATGRDHRTVDRAGRGAGDNCEGRRASAKGGDLADPLEHTRLVGAARAAGGQDQTQHLRTPMRPI